MGKELDILVTADPYGYGPASKAKTVAEYLRRASEDVSIQYLAAGTALDFGELNSATYDGIVDAAETPIRTYVEQSDADLLVSVMEPEPVITAHVQDIPTVTVDSLFWFWEFSEPLEIVDRIRELESDERSLRSYVDGLTGNDLDLAAHAVADRSFLQVYPGETQIDDVTDAVGGVTEVNPITDTGPRDPSVERDRVLVSLGGQLNPAVSQENAVRYAEAVLAVLEPFLESFDERGFEPIVAGHPAVVENVSTPYEATALEHREMLSTLNRAAGLLCPPSITSVYEAVMYDVPTFFIPEQHPGHWHEFQRLRSAADGDPFPGVILGREFESLRNMTKQDQDKKQGFDQVEADAEKILAGVERVREWSHEEIRTAFSDCERLEGFVDAAVREEVSSRQREAVLNDGDGEAVSGGAQIAEKALSLATER